MNLINIQYTLLDTFSGCETTMNVQRDVATYQRMKDNVGAIYNGYIVISVSKCDDLKTIY